jgi:hypothetical protein
MAKKSKDREPTVSRPKARNDAYVMMLFATLLAIATGCVLMYLDWDEYGQKTAPTEKAPALPKLGEAPSTGGTGGGAGAGGGAGGAGATGGGMGM